MSKEEERGEDIVSEFLRQNRELAPWVKSFRGFGESNKQWCARREFILRNMEAFPTVERGVPSPALDRLLSLSMAWANHIFLGCKYPTAVMEKIKELGEGIVVSEFERITTQKRSATSGADTERYTKKRSRFGPLDAAFRTRDEFMAKGKRRFTAGSDMHHRFVKRTKVRSNDGERLTHWPTVSDAKTSANYSEITTSTSST